MIHGSKNIIITPCNLPPKVSHIHNQLTDSWQNQTIDPVNDKFKHKVSANKVELIMENKNVPATNNEKTLQSEEKSSTLKSSGIKRKNPYNVSLFSPIKITSQNTEVSASKTPHSTFRKSPSLTHSTPGISSDTATGSTSGLSHPFIPAADIKVTQSKQSEKKVKPEVF